jgi:threonine dehydratase
MDNKTMDNKTLEIFSDKNSDKALLAIETEDEIYRFVKGLRKPRINPVTFKQIQKHMDRHPMFKNVDVFEALACLIKDNKISGGYSSLRSARGFRGAYVYE